MNILILWVKSYLELYLKKIEPLLKDNKFNEAKQMVRDFYKPSRFNIVDREGDVIFIEYDMIMAKIHLLKNNLK